MKPKLEESQTSEIEQMKLKLRADSGCLYAYAEHAREQLRHERQWQPMKVIRDYPKGLANE